MSNTTTPHDSKKRKRGASREEQLEQESVERYDKLVHQARKALHKQAKTVKQFESQKMARRLKQTHSSQNEEKLARIKAFSLQNVEETCLQRLGIYNLNPQPDQSRTKITLSNEEEALLEKFVSHKKMVQAMDVWNDKVTEYRQWLLRRRERISAPPDFTNNKKQNKKNKSKNDASDLFVCLGATEEDTDASLYYGPSSLPNDDDEYASIVKKRNRPGQRARKAKAMAIQAKKEGRSYKSVNWREKKPDKKNTTTEKPRVTTKQTTIQAAEIASMGKSWKEEGKEHPSWAASQSQKKSAIVAFQGKKITFDWYNSRWWALSCTGGRQMNYP